MRFNCLLLHENIQRETKTDTEKKHSLWSHEVWWSQSVALCIYLLPTRRVAIRFFFPQYLPLFWPVPQWRSDIELNLSLSQNTPISIVIHIVIHRYVYGDAAIELLSKFLVYSVNNTRARRLLIHVISLCLLPIY